MAKKELVNDAKEILTELKNGITFHKYKMASQKSIDYLKVFGNFSIGVLLLAIPSVVLEKTWLSLSSAATESIDTLITLLGAILVLVIIYLGIKATFRSLNIERRSLAWLPVLCIMQLTISFSSFFDGYNLVYAQFAIVLLAMGSIVSQSLIEIYQLFLSKNKRDKLMFAITSVIGIISGFAMWYSLDRVIEIFALYIVVRSVIIFLLSIDVKKTMKELKAIWGKIKKALVVEKVKHIDIFGLVVIALLSTMGAFAFNDIGHGFLEIRHSIEASYLNQNSVELSDAQKFSKEYTSVPGDNMFIYRNADEIIRIMQNGTGVVYLGFPECPWCQAYVKYLYEVAKEEGVETIYYFNIAEDRKENSDQYKEIVSLLEGNLQYDDEGNSRIYVPNVSFHIDGKLIGNDHETSKDTLGYKYPSEYWSDERIENLKGVLRNYMQQIIEAGGECEKTCDI
jgi:hypothetical protein